jgi:hypothetical protein
MKIDAVDRQRWVPAGLLALSGLLTLAAHFVREWPGCAWGDYGSLACFTQSAEPPGAGATVLQGLATAALAIALLVVSREFGRDAPRAQWAAGLLGILGLLAAVGILQLAWLLAFPVLVFVALGNRGTSWALVLGSPLVQVLILPLHLSGSRSYDVIPWGQLVTGLILLLAASTVRSGHRPVVDEGALATVP